MRGRNVLLIILFAAIAIYIGYKVAAFNLFDTDFVKLKSINLPNKGYSLQLYLIPSNASSQSYIQVRKSEANVIEVVANYERYNWVEDYSVDDSLLHLILKDTSLVNSKADTLLLRLP